MKSWLIVVLIVASFVFVASAVARSYPHVGGYKGLSNFQINRLQ